MCFRWKSAAPASEPPGTAAVDGQGLGPVRYQPREPRALPPLDNDSPELEPVGEAVADELSFHSGRLYRRNPRTPTFLQMSRDPSNDVEDLVGVRAEKDTHKPRMGNVLHVHQVCSALAHVGEVQCSYHLLVAGPRPVDAIYTDKQRIQVEPLFEVEVWSAKAPKTKRKKKTKGPVAPKKARVRRGGRIRGRGRGRAILEPSLAIEDGRANSSAGSSNPSLDSPVASDASGTICLCFFTP